MTEEELRGARRKAQEVWTETDDVDARGSRCDMWETYVGRRGGRDFEVDLGEGYLREGCGLQASCGDKRPSEQVLDAMAAEENRSARQRDAREEGMRKRDMQLLGVEDALYAAPAELEALTEAGGPGAVTGARQKTTPRTDFEFPCRPSLSPRYHAGRTPAGKYADNRWHSGQGGKGAEWECECDKGIGSDEMEPHVHPCANPESVHKRLGKQATTSDVWDGVALSGALGALGALAGSPDRAWGYKQHGGVAGMQDGLERGRAFVPGWERGRDGWERGRAFVPGEGIDLTGDGWGESASRSPRTWGQHETRDACNAYSTPTTPCQILHEVVVEPDWHLSGA
jgi:hypothetical protein